MDLLGSCWTCNDLQSFSTLVGSGEPPGEGGGIGGGGDSDGKAIDIVIVTLLRVSFKPHACRGDSYIELGDSQSSTS